MKISVITVCFNASATIETTINSVAAQTHGDWEHIIIDGGSTDGTVDTLERHRSRLAHVSSEPDKGIYDAMNKGLNRATGDIIGFLNADDLYADNEVLTRIVEAFENPAIEACYGDLVYVTEDNKKVVRFWKSEKFSLGSFAKGWCPAHPTFYIRRSALERLGFFDLTYGLAADAEFMMRYMESGGVCSIYIPHVQVRMRMGGATNQSWGNIIRQNKEIFHALRKNGVCYSVVSFWANKLSIRLWQRMAGLLHRG